MKTRSLLAAPLLALSLTLAAPPVLAAGTIKPSRTELTEVSGGWKVFLEVKLGKKPATAHQPFRFVFKRTVLYETFLDDAHGDAEQTRSIPTPDAADQIESIDVGFADAKGDIWDSTKLDFTIRRDRGYEAGEYKVEVRDSDNRLVGSAFTLKLQGKNTVVDRRAMVMQDPKKKKEKPKEDPKPADDKKDEKKDDKGSDAGTGSGGGGDDDAAKKAAAPPPAVPPKKSGCGCEVPGAPAPLGFAAVALGLCALAVRRRRG